jgi:hypothetical protein
VKDGGRCSSNISRIIDFHSLCGRQVIEKNYVDFFRQLHPTNLNCTIDQVSTVGTVSGNSGAFSFTLQGEKFREYGAWKECTSCYNMASAPAKSETK